MNGAVVLMYHRLGNGRLSGRDPGEHLYAVSPEAFEAQLDTILHSRCSPVPAESLGAATGRADMPPRPLAITFDDGNASDHAVALPALRRRGLPAAFFITPAWIGTPGYLDWAEARALVAEGMSVGAHGLDHTSLDTLTEDALRTQLSEARRLLEARLGKAPVSLALPGGAGGRREVRVAREVGFELVLGSVPRLAPADPLDPVPRFAVRRGDSLRKIRALAEQRRGVRLRFEVRHQVLGAVRRILGPRGHARMRNALVELVRDE